MSVDDRIDLRVDGILEQAAANHRDTCNTIGDLIRWGYYGPNVFSQFGLGLAGFVFRHKQHSIRMTIKVVEGGVPLVAFVTSATLTGSVEQMFDLLYHDKLKWQKDKYPWI
jgi:hypothetical protein